MPNQPRTIRVEDESREDREDAQDLRISLLVRGAVREAVLEHALSPDERQWVRLAIQKEAQSIKLRQAIIEKTLTGLVWAVIVGIGVVVGDYFKNHGWKP